MLQALRDWRRRRVLTRSAIPDALWNEALATLPFMVRYEASDLARLRDIVVLFLDSKGILGARGHEVTPLQRVVIAIQACVLVLNLDLTYYDGFENIVVYPGEFVPGWEWEDEAGVVHRHEEPLAGEAMPRGPVVLSWPDVEAASDWETAGMNLVVHEFAHKLDMKDGDANGCPPLPPHIDAGEWKRAFSQAFDDFSARVEADEPTDIDPYAAENPGEFFAVVSEVFFADPLALRECYPTVYGHLAAFYRQNPVED